MKIYKPYYNTNIYNKNINNINYYFYQHSIKYQNILKELNQLNLNKKKYFELNQIPIFMPRQITDIYDNFNEKMDICWENCIDILYN